MNIKSGLLFLTIFEINVNAFAKRRNDLDYLKTNAHQLHVSRILFILYPMSHRLIVNDFFELNSVISKRHGPLPSSQFKGRLPCKHARDRWFDGWCMVIFQKPVADACWWEIIFGYGMNHIRVSYDFSTLHQMYNCYCRTKSLLRLRLFHLCM